MKKLALLIFLLYTSICVAQNPPSIDELEHQKNLEEIAKMMQENQNLANERTAQTKLDCIKAFGNEDFCDFAINER